MTSRDGSLSYPPVVARHVPLPPEPLWRCWTEEALISRWFAPPPWRVERAALDVRPGGRFAVDMRDAETGEPMLFRGVCLAVEPGRRIVWTDAYTEAWVPAAKPFLTVTVTFEPDANGTRYTEHAAHWTAADRAAHEAMGLIAGWNTAADELEAVARSLD